MRVILLMTAIGLAACSITPDVTPETNTSAELQASFGNTLPPQTLNDGECGLFGWDGAGATRFVFFAKDRSALYADGQTIRTLEAQSPFPATDYGSVQIVLGPAEALIDGVRYPQARLTEVLDDGFTRIQPLVMLESCPSS
ncbi:MAG: hypothetical protein AAF926_01055 [Pseudomonadota bacterium]